MIKKISLLSLFVFIYLFYTATYAIAVTPTSAPAKPSERWVCLQAASCLKDESACFKKGGHRARLSVKSEAKLLPNKETHVIECLETETGPKCTTGESSHDVAVFGSDANLNLLQKKPEEGGIGYKFEGFFGSAEGKINNPVNSNAAGELPPVEWKSFNPPPERARKFLALNYFTETAVTGAEGGQQQATFKFDEAYKNCVSIRWDPYGRVFDSQSLEPMAEAKVSLLKKEGTNFVVFVDQLTGVRYENIDTKIDGTFNFVVPDGIYRLEVVYSGHKFPFNSGNIHPNYNKAYFDLYYASGSADFKNQDIVQSGSVIHRDIPLDPVGQPYSASIKLIGYLYNKKNSAQIEVEGTVSHPLSEITAYTKIPTASPAAGFTRGKLLTTGTADKWGHFKLDIDITKVKSPEVCCQIKARKIDLRALTNQNKNYLDNIFSFLKKLTSIKETQAQQQQETTFDIEPILNYVEGYTYNQSGKTIPGATVGVYMSFSDKPYYETKADQTGYFRISSENLPFMPYELRYTAVTGANFKTPTSKFIAQNIAFFNENKINLNNYKNKEGKEIAVESLLTPTKPPGFKETGFAEKKPVATETKKTSGSSDTIIFVAAILLLLISIVGVLLGFYLYKKRQQNFNSP